MNITKKLYKGTYNYSHEVRNLFCFARSEKEAHIIFKKRLATLYGVKQYVIDRRFNGEKDNYEVREDKG